MCAVLWNANRNSHDPGLPKLWPGTGQLLVVIMYSNEPTRHGGALDLWRVLYGGGAVAIFDACSILFNGENSSFWFSGLVRVWLGFVVFGALGLSQALTWSCVCRVVQVKCCREPFFTFHWRLNGLIFSVFILGKERFLKWHISLCLHTKFIEFFVEWMRFRSDYPCGFSCH